MINFSEKFEARADGKVLLEHLSKVLVEMDRLEAQAKPILEAQPGPNQQIPNSVKMLAAGLSVVTSELRDFVESLKPLSSGESGSSGGDSDDESLTVDAVRRRFEEKNKSILGA